MKEDVKNFLFDLGNVIIDIDVEGALERLQKLFRSDADKSLIQKAFLDYECGRISTDLFINAMLKQSNQDVQAIDVIEAWNSMLISIPPQRLTMLGSLKDKYNVYLLSNTNELHLDWVYRHLLNDHHVNAFEKDYFHNVYYSHLLGDRKPAHSIFKRILQHAAIDPGSTLYMDDLQENLDAAAELGFRTYLVKPEKDISIYLKEEGYY